MKEFRTSSLSQRPGRVNGIPVSEPTLPDIEQVFAVVSESYASGMVTCGRIVALFEEEVQSFIGVEHAVAVSSCTSGLMLAFSAMGFAEAAEVIVPSFTFAATIQALVWNRLVPVYVDCLPGTMTIDPEAVVSAVSRKTAAICPVTVFGLPPDLAVLGEISDRYGLPLISDSAQGLGATYQGRRIGSFGLCEVFSLSPGKVITAMEGGIITTSDSVLAGKLKSMRDYGKGPDGHEIVLQGLSARFVELNAAVGLLNLREAHSLLAARARLIRSYRARLRSLRGCCFQETPSDRTSCGSIFAFLAPEDNPDVRDAVFEALRDNGIQSRKYFYPPAHSHRVFRDKPHRIVGDLAVTRSYSSRCLALPLYSHMADEHLDRVCSVVESILA